MNASPHFRYYLALVLLLLLGLASRVRNGADVTERSASVDTAASPEVPTQLAVRR